ncbi:MAG: cysteine--tRNA ligase [Proteobacteria bacterium]|nr:cysteine--tRNA ligase [Pseudomonadota bacterium]
MLQIYNTFTHQKEPFKPLVPGKISLYVCGITVYDYCHIGHARVFVAFDVIVRFLRASGWQVKYVRNITDIDDKIIKRANENNEPIEALTTRFIQAMNEDAKALNVLPPDEEPKATAHIQTIIDMVKKLQDKGVAYVADTQDVYFEVAKYDSYGQLAHKDLTQLQAGARVEVVTQKHSNLDFVLWKKAKPQEPHWLSPWGEGRPGWHIECSAMSTACLGDTFDIHGGGSDLVFPHHENERAQSECATGSKFVNTWMHVGFVQVDKEKMSKSLNNFFTIREVLAQYDAEIIRYFLMASHYRSPVNYSKELLDQAKSSLERLYTALRGATINKQARSERALEFKTRFYDAMNDDFNTPVAFSVLFDLATAVNSAREAKFEEFEALVAMLKELASVLGLLERSPDEFLQGKIDSQEIEQLIKARIDARTNKDWRKADEIRQQLTQMGVVLEDTPQGTTWRKA